MREKDKFFKILADEKYGIYPASTNAQLALNVISEYILGEDYYVVDPIHNEQVNTILTHDILYKVSKKYRKDFKKFKKRSLKSTAYHHHYSGSDDELRQNKDIKNI